MTLSALVFSKDSASVVEKALRSVQFADEILLIDMMSEDDTVKIAAPLASHVYSHRNVGYVEPVRNFALSKAKGDWVLVLDADESVTPALRETIQAIISNTASADPGADCYYLPRKNMIFGEWARSAGWWPDYVLRLFRAGHVEWSEAIHSVPITRGTVAELPALETHALLHHNYQTVEQFVDRLNRYTTIQAKESGDQPRRPESGAASIVRAFRNELLSRLFAREGVAGGTLGVGLSLLQAFSETVVALKVWQQSDRPGAKNTRAVVEELASLQRDLAYWVADWQVQHCSGLARVVWQVRRRLRI